jgi:hypothetical protein
MRIEQVVSNPATGVLTAEVYAEAIRSLWPLMERFGVADAAEVELETLKQRFVHEFVDNQFVWSGVPSVGAWVRTPSEIAP